MVEKGGGITLRLFLLWKMVIQFRNKATGRKVERWARLTHEHPARILFRNGKALDPNDWLAARAKLVRGTKIERAQVAGWLAHNLPQPPDTGSP